MRKFVLTLRKHQKAVVAFIDTRVTNAVAEGINRIVKIIKNRASVVTAIWRPSPT